MLNNKKLMTAEKIQKMLNNNPASLDNSFIKVE